MHLNERLDLLKPLRSLWNVGPQQLPSTGLGSGWSSLARPMWCRRLLSRHRCFAAKSASVDQPWAFPEDSTPGLALWCWIQAFVVCGLSSPICAFLSPFRWGSASPCSTALRLRQLFKWGTSNLFSQGSRHPCLLRWEFNKRHMFELLVACLILHVSVKACVHGLQYIGTGLGFSFSFTSI